MPTVKGRSEVKRYLAQLPEEIERKLLRGAARAGGKVIMDEIAEETPSDDVRDNLRMRSQAGDGRIVVKIDVKPGWARSVAIWLEYGTDPHFITVDDSQRQGMTANRINKLGKAGTLVIAGKPVGATVHHPGARPHPTFRPALDRKEAEAVAAAQSYINSRVTRSGIVGTAEGDDE